MESKIIPFAKIRVAAIMDDFTYNNFKDECNILQLIPDYCIQQLDEFKPDLIFLESAWHGKHKLWVSKMRGQGSDEVDEIINWAKFRKIPTAYWAKEDPVHYGAFLNLAKKCDYTFTTDIDCIPWYKAELGHDRVYLLPFACQPKLQNPIEFPDGRKPGFSFAGAYYRRFPERMENLENIFDALKKIGPLAIYNRFYEYDWPRYRFPEKYHENILPNLDYKDIDQAYKGYEWAINLNTVKYSQTMFARRVFELMASGTPVISNFSQGVRNFFGDLVFMSDNGANIARRLTSVSPLELDKIKLAALRKVLDQHTYKKRFEYIALKTLGVNPPVSFPPVLCVSSVGDIASAVALSRAFSSQTCQNKRLCIICPAELLNSIKKSCPSPDIFVFEDNLANNLKIGEIVNGEFWVTTLDSRDWHGKNYLKDMILASQFAAYPALGKATFWKLQNGGIARINPGEEYKLSAALPLRRAIINSGVLGKDATFGAILNMIAREEIFAGLSLDSLSYCEDGAGSPLAAATLELSDPLDQGLDIEELNRLAETTGPGSPKAPVTLRFHGPRRVASLFPEETMKENLSLDDDAFYIECPAAEDKKMILSSTLSLGDYRNDDILKTALNAHGSAGYAIRFLDESQILLCERICPPHVCCAHPIPGSAAAFQIGLLTNPERPSYIYSLNFGDDYAELGNFASHSDYLLVTSGYPDYDDLYKNAFVHGRIKEYRKNGLNVDIFVHEPGRSTRFREYNGINIVSGDIRYLKKILSSHSYKKVLVHFLYYPVWKIMRGLPGLKKIVWAHGSEIQPWHRRLFNFNSRDQLELEQQKSMNRMGYWKQVLYSRDDNLKLVFVSRYFAEEVMEDYKIRLPEDRFAIIHNPVDTDIFKYRALPSENRYKIILLRSFYSPKYGNDLAVKCIFELSKRNDFNKFEILVAGDGALFEETVAPLRAFPNIRIEKRFYSPEEMAELYPRFGVCLTPTRWDSQGVARDEAMACGLVPATNKVAAIPEFVDENCAILAPPENASALAEGIGRLADDPELFMRMSRAAAENVRRSRPSRTIIAREIDLITS
ncbi:MAG: glycosyltransferase [Desulfovibrio sp.]|nr:glycosyltransferase [Desulfovibrio sp.]